MTMSATVVADKGIVLRQSICRESARVGSAQKGQSVDVLLLQRTMTGTLRAQTTLGWATATTRDGKELLAGPGCESTPQAETNTEEQKTSCQEYLTELYDLSSIGKYRET